MYETFNFIQLGGGGGGGDTNWMKSVIQIKNDINVTLFLYEFQQKFILLS